jgi:membrane-associated phospholipid phosphatase
MQTYRNSPWVWLPPLVSFFLLLIIYFSGANRSLFLALNHLGHGLGEECWANLTILGDGAVALALIAPWIKRSPQRFWAALIAAVLAALWVQVPKHLVDVPRPLAVFPPQQFFHTGPGYRAVSFPSGHSAAAFAITGIWIMSLTRHYLLRSLLLILAVLVSLSRVMVGVHWPLDLLGGMLGGWLAAWTGLLASTHWGWKTSGFAGYLAGFGLLFIAAALLVSTHIGHPETLPFQRILGLICLVWGSYEMLQMRMQMQVLPRRKLHADPKRE